MVLLQLLTGLCLIPFVSASLSFVYDLDDYACLNIPSNNLTLRYWLAVDAYVKIAVYVSTWFFNAIASGLRARSMLIICESTLLRFYYYFLLGWMVTGSVIYWGNIYPYNDCDSSLNAYLFALIIISYVEIILNVFVITCLRGQEDEEEGETITITNRETELIAKR